MAGPSDDIMRKIKKCLALSSSSEPNEAAAALRQAQKLMEKHGLTTMDVAVSEINETDVRSTAGSTKVPAWELKLMRLVAEAFGCHLLWMRGNSHGRTAKELFGSWRLVGPSSQLPIAQYTAQVLLRKLTKARAPPTCSSCPATGRVPPRQLRPTASASVGLRRSAGP
jgi:hypothetical protein